MPQPRKTRNRSEKFKENIEKRGQIVPVAKKEGSPVGPVLLAFFIFVVVGSALLEILKVAF
eukprot:CAMPEP_0177640274 /NCGR_PEP_ID=MMETSP0447-20121125/6458_1 /TAXON_ID=0 /ORGANISM="Stygamoeba regulata, Strain BSH-02190019" /LENGTH=60 /DNA_ID=CAMNT_0019142339 /DNA_START=55 /DNA_END=237 /DNA_ORIENTATION=+